MSAPWPPAQAQGPALRSDSASAGGAARAETSPRPLPRRGASSGHSHRTSWRWTPQQEAGTSAKWPPEDRITRASRPQRLRFGRIRQEDRDAAERTGVLPIHLNRCADGRRRDADSRRAPLDLALAAPKRPTGAGDAVGDSSRYDVGPDAPVGRAPVRALRGQRLRRRRHPAAALREGRRAATARRLRAPGRRGVGQRHAPAGRHRGRAADRAGRAGAPGPRRENPGRAHRPLLRLLRARQGRGPAAGGHPGAAGDA